MFDSALAFASVAISLVVALLTWWNNRHNRVTILGLRQEVTALEIRVERLDNELTDAREERDRLKSENHRLLNKIVNPQNCGVQYCPHPRSSDRPHPASPG